MKIVFVLNHFLPDHIAGTEMYALNLGRGLMQSQHEVAFVIPNYGSRETEFYVHEGCKVVKYAEPSIVDKALQMGKRKPDGLNHFLEALKAETPDIVHFYELAGSNGIGIHHVELAKQAGLKVVMTFHLSGYTSTSDTLKVPDDIFDNRRGALNFYRNKGFSKLLAYFVYAWALVFKLLRIDVSPLGKWGTALAVPQLIEEKRKRLWRLIDSADKIVTIAKWYHELLIKNGVSENKLRFIEQAIPVQQLENSEDFTEPKSSQNLQDLEPLKIIFVGRISHFKGVKMLIEVLASFNSNQVRLDIYGDSGEDENYIQACKQMAETVAHIRFQGRLNPEKVLQTISDYDILVLPSTIHEMSPLVIREAFAAGIPVLASDTAGSSEQVKDGENGWLFRMNDKEDLKRKLQMLIDHPEKINEARKHIPPPRDFQQLIEEHEGMYESILNGSNQSLRLS